MLLNNDVTPIIVFDGGKLKSKKGTEKGREDGREKAKELAKEYLERGDEAAAMKEFSKSIDITP